MTHELPQLIAAGIAEATGLIEARVAEQLAELQKRVDAHQVTILEERAAHAERLESVRQEARAEVQREIQRAVDQAVQDIRGAALALPVPTDWRERTYYQGEAVHHRGGTWVATRKTADEPRVGGDWTLLADGVAEVTKGGDSVFIIRTSETVTELADMRGAQGEGFRVRGLYQAGETYSKGDLVLENGSRFVALKDDPGAFPGAGWELFVQRGSKGTKGEQGPRGEKGLDGAHGPSLLEDLRAWRDGRLIESGSLVHHDGKLFVALDDTTSPPGTGSAWLRVKGLGE
jgi:hypothetical protein